MTRKVASRPQVKPGKFGVQFWVGGEVCAGGRGGSERSTDIFWVLTKRCILVDRWVRRQLSATSVKEHIMSRLQGKTAVVTGGGSGIGLGAAKRFVDEGAFVYLFGRRQEALDAAVAQLGSSARAISGSVTDMSDLDRLYAAVKAERGGVDI